VINPVFFHYHTSRSIPYLSTLRPPRSSSSGIVWDGPESSPATHPTYSRIIYKRIFSRSLPDAWIRHTFPTTGTLCKRSWWWSFPCFLTDWVRSTFSWTGPNPLFRYSKWSLVFMTSLSTRALYLILIHSFAMKTR